jgi:hypothetical protein
MRHNPGNRDLAAYLKTLTFQALTEFCELARLDDGCRTIDLRDRKQVDV